MQCMHDTRDRAEARTHLPGHKLDDTRQNFCSDTDAKITCYACLDLVTNSHIVQRQAPAWPQLAGAGINTEHRAHA